jgi:hypothetical protein
MINFRDPKSNVPREVDRTLSVICAAPWSNNSLSELVEEPPYEVGVAVKTLSALRKPRFDRVNPRDMLISLRLLMCGFWQWTRENFVRDVIRMP